MTASNPVIAVDLLVDPASYVWATQSRVHLYAAITFAVLGIAVLIAERGNHFSRVFIAFSLACVGWQLARAGMVATTQPPLELLLARLRFSFVLVVLPAVFHLILVGLYKHRQRRNLVTIVWALSVAMAFMTAITPWFVVRMQDVPWGREPVWGAAGYVIPVLTLFTIVVVVWDWFQSYRQMRHHPGERIRLRFLMGFVVFMALGSADYLPSMGFEVVPKSTFLVLVFALGCAAMAIRYGWNFVTPELAGEQLMERAPAPMFMVDAMGYVRRANPAASQFFGTSSADMHNRPLTDWLGESAEPDNLAMIAAVRGDAEPVAEVLDASNNRRRTSLSVVDVGARNAAYVVRLFDLEGHLARADVEQKSSRTDALTEVANRQAFFQLIEETLARSAPSDAYAVFVVGLSNMRRINRTIGYDDGDRVLQAIASHLRSDFVASPAVGRVGGDEFAVLLTKSEASPLLLRRWIAEMADRCHRLTGQEIVRIHGGTAALNATMEVSQAVSAASAACLEASKHGHALESYESLTRTEGPAPDEVIAQALSDDELHLYLQPVIDIGRQQVVGFEALVRWLHPTRGLVATSEFITLLESDALSRRFDRWALNQACLALKALAKAGHGDVWVSVNLTNSDLEGGGTVGVVRELIATHDVNGERLHLELTERLAMMPENLAVLNDMQAMGIHLSIDDFGTGYSSMSRVATLPLSTLKIDRSFVTQMRVSPRSRVLVGGLVALARGLELEVVAEGVEFPQDLEYLSSVGVNYVQGFMFSRAVPLAEALEVLTTSNWVSDRQAAADQSKESLAGR